MLVTGSTSGIGEGIARRFAQEGAAVIIHGRRSEAAERVVLMSIKIPHLWRRKFPTPS